MSEFPTPTRDDWRDLVSGVLAKAGRTGVDPEDALSYTTYDGITIRPLYTAADAPESPSAGVWAAESPEGWDVRVRHTDPDVERTKHAVVQDLERGATSLWLTVGDGAIAVGDIAAVLDGVYLDLAPIVLDAGVATEDAAAVLLDLASAKGIEPGSLAGSLGADPIAARARTGAAADLDVLARLVALRGQAAVRIATVDATVYHDAGASDAQEIGIAAAVGVAYLRELTGAGLSLDDALDAIEFRFAVTDEQFPSIAKLRAARRVWDRVAELSGAADEHRGQHQHAVTSSAMLTRRDPWVNMLRTTIACFAAVVGDADAITVAPFDSAIGLSDDFARRIARNTQAVLHDESSLARVTDAAGGSWFVESLTDQVAEAAWTVFTGLERAGGAAVALDVGTIAAMVSATQDRRADDVAHRRVPITGVSEFAFVGEQPVARASVPSAPAGLLPTVRYAQDFESLRDAAEAGERRPVVFLAALGLPAVHAARVGFATNLFAAGGVDAVVGVAADPSDLATMIDEFRRSGTVVACVCSTDKLYAEFAADAAAALRDAGAKLIWLAGRSEVDGVDGTIFAGCDALDVLHTSFDVLGVAR